MKGNVSLNESQDWGIQPKGEPGSEGPLGRPPLSRIDGAPGNPLGSEPRCQRVECRSDLVQLANAGGIDCAYAQPASAASLDELLAFEQLQGMADRLA
jgi:hypothetical protein